MSVHWEIEYPGLELHGAEIAWTMKNLGDETAPDGSVCGEVTIWQNASNVDSTPWTNPLTLSRDVPAQTAHTMTYPVAWDGQPHGSYTARITLPDNVMAEIYFNVTLNGVEHGWY